MPVDNLGKKGRFSKVSTVFQIMFLVPPAAGLEGAPLSKAYHPYVVEGGQPIIRLRRTKNSLSGKLLGEMGDA